jgi:hypothetical protein
MSAINMTFTNNGNGVSTKPKTKPVHPQIMKIMSSNSHNKPANNTKSISTNTILNANAMNILSNIQGNIQGNKKNFNIYQAQAQQQLSQTPTKKSFNMNFAQLSTSKPCGSCGGR